MTKETLPDYSEEISCRDVEEAHDILKGVIKDTPIEKSRSISEITGGEVFLKLENLQRGGSFKIRGAYNLLYHTRKDVVAASAGNHSQGVALASSLLGLKSLIVMPEFAPPIKVAATKGYGGEVLLYGKTFDESTEKAREIAIEKGRIFAHAFDNPYVIAGQGTIGLEIMEKLDNLDYVIIPIGGGGLISGISLYLKKKGFKGKIIGVESEKAASMKESLNKGVPVKLESISTIADGIAIKSPSIRTYSLVKKYVDEVVTVTDDEISSAMFVLLERGKVVAEPAGAVSVAAITTGKIDVKGKRVLSLISGGNVDMTLLTQIIENNLIDLGREFTMTILMDNRPGELKKALDLFSSMKLNVEELNSELFGADICVGKQKISLRLKIYGNEDLIKIRKTFDLYGFKILDIKGVNF
ncbi:MAG: threonine ammonia-lyase [Thermoplasmata archaeon]